MSAFDDTIESLKVNGQVLMVEAYEPPWAISIPDGDTLRDVLGVRNDTKIVPFHLVRRGAFVLEQDGAEPILVRAEEVVLCTADQSHRMVQGTALETISFLDILGSKSRSDDTCVSAGATELICGVFMLRDSPRNPLIEALPDVLHADISGRDGRKTLEVVASLLIDELQSSKAGKAFMAARLLELFCGECLRTHMVVSEHDRPGWFRAMKDSQLASALDAFHADPGRDWSVSSLADIAGMSGSRFAAKFRGMLGVAPMHYAASWRMNVAARLLSDTQKPLSDIAFEVGYESLAAFSRAFKKHVDVPPAQWRKEHQVAEPIAA